MPGLLVSLLLVVVAVLIIWKGSQYFERAAERLSKHYGLPVAVHGAIVVAVGSSFPEISSIVISTVVHGEFSLGVGAIVGSAIFNLLVIPAFSALASENLEATRDIVHKDGQFLFRSGGRLVRLHRRCCLSERRIDHRCVPGRSGGMISVGNVPSIQ